MKKILFLAVASLGLLNTSCTSDDESNSNAEIAGTWKISKRVILSGVDGTVLETTNITGCLAQNTFTYEEDSSFKEMYYGAVTSGCELTDEVTGTYLYTPSTKILRLKYAGESSPELVYLQNVAHLTMEAYSFDDDFNGDGVTDKYVRFMYR